jgi:hypothetical protein
MICCETIGIGSSTRITQVLDQPCELLSHYELAVDQETQ